MYHDFIMKPISFFCFIMVIGLISCNDSDDKYDQRRKNLYAQIIPEPAKVEVQKNNLLLKSDFTIYHDNDFGDISDQKLMLQEFMAERLRYVDKGNTAFNIISKPSLGEECYELSINDSGIYLYASTKKGIFYGMQTFFQLFLSITDNQLSYLSIEDCPRFTHRGLMLDPARHFIPVEDIKSFIDIMSFYKFNKLHLHLSDDEGWRVEIKGLHELNHKEAGHGIYGEKRARYTQEELIGIVKYAAAREVEIIPEIDIPDHNHHIASIYPEMKCGGPSSKNGQLCASNDKVLDFMSIVISELADIFPSSNFHLGGDEVSVETMKDCEVCQNKMKQLGYQKEEQLLSYLFENTAKILERHQKSPMFWFDFNIMDYPVNSTVYSWIKERSPEAISISKSKNYKLICSPDEYSYFNYPQAWENEPPFDNWGMPALLLYDIYNFDPTFGLPSEQASAITGIEALLWSEYMTSVNTLFYMAYPRAIAFSECGWSYPENKDWIMFCQRLKYHLKYLSQKGINYRHPAEI